ncbi:MAG TPA: addiction module protein [Nitrospiria bacterium]|nr:addiction module protein [Nitrospiria bacterium]
MSLTVEKIALELLGLPTKSRALLAEKLIESLEEKQDRDTESLWMREAKKRSREIKSGKVRCRPAKDALKEARSKLK